MTNRNKRWFVAEWTTGLTRALERKTDRAARIEVAQSTEQAPGRLIWWAQPYGGLDPGIWIGVSEEDCRDFARGVGAGRVEEFWRMVSESSAPAGQGRPASGPPDDTECIAVDITCADVATLRLFVAVDDELPRQADVTRPSRHDARASSDTLDLILDLELPVSVSFGKIQLPFQEVLKLATGSIVELNRSVDDPVDILVNDQVIASGDVVVVNGNYGVKIQRIASRSERLRSADAALLARGVEEVIQ